MPRYGAVWLARGEGLGEAQSRAAGSGGGGYRTRRGLSSHAATKPRTAPAAGLCLRVTY